MLVDNTEICVGVRIEEPRLTHEAEAIGVQGRSGGPRALKHMELGFPVQTPTPFSEILVSYFSDLSSLATILAIQSNPIVLPPSFILANQVPRIPTILHVNKQ